MAWNVEHTDEFAEWYRGLSEAHQDDITARWIAADGDGTAIASSIFVRD
jgi:hypothetical protein